MIRSIVGFDGQIVYDTSMPDGTPRKLLDSSVLFSLGWKPGISLEEGLVAVYKDYVKNSSNYRK
jgi:GDP-L-fucose synthase